MFDVGIQELIVIFIVALIVFGPKRLPELGKAIGKGIFELKKALESVKEQIDIEESKVDQKPEGKDTESATEKIKSVKNESNDEDRKERDGTVDGK